MKAKIFEIKRFAVHDGDGIRTTVFFKGCPLECVWCHNPEGIAFKQQLAYYSDKCVNCGECVNVCTFGAHNIEDGIHILDRDKCSMCGRCEDACIGDALVFYGKEFSLSRLLEKLLEDKDFYDNSGGGVTFSGGECLMQADLCAELARLLKENNIHTAIDTCGFVSRDAIDKVLPYTDIFLYDIKAYDDEVHIKCTGQSNKIILENLEYIDKCGVPVEIRIPYVPGYNDDQIEKIGQFLSKLSNVKKVKVLPYHNYAGSKYMSLSLKNTLPKLLPNDDEIKKAEECLKKYNLHV